MKLLIHGAAAAFALSTFVAGSASAADLPDYVAPPAAVAAADWAGFYAGLHGGGGWADLQSTFLSGATSPADFGLSGPYVGGQLGYNWQTGSTVFGIEGDVSWSGIHGTRSSAITTTQELNWLATVRGRLGWSQGTWLPYITGGVAFASGTRANDGAGPQTASASHTGWTAGAGIEWALASSWTWKAEYKYLDLGSSNYNFTTNPASVDIKAHTFEIGINKHF